MSSYKVNASVIPGIADIEELGNNATAEEDTTNKPAVESTEYQNNEQSISINDDKEAEIKNLKFQGVPNSVIRNNMNNSNARTSVDLNSERQSLNRLSRVFTNDSNRTNRTSNRHDRRRSSHFIDRALHDHEAESPSSNVSNEYRRYFLDHRRSFSQHSDEQFNIWRKEFNNAFKKISVLSKLKHMKGSNLQHITKQSTQVTNAEKDLYTQRLASDLLNSLLAGCPAALFASTQFLRDEHGHRRAPLLLAMLGVTVETVDGNDFSEIFSGSNENIIDPIDTNCNNLQRHMSTTSSSSSSIFSNTEDKKNSNTFYKVNLEYGIGENRMKWSVIKSFKELATMHNKLRIVTFQQNTINKLYIDNNSYHTLHLPRFPRFNDSLKTNNLNDRSNPVTPNASLYQLASTDNNHSMSPRRSNNYSVEYNIQLKHLQDVIDQKENTDNPMNIRLQRYLRLLNLSLCLRPQANRLFQFYEFSPISNLLSYEDGYQGKEGYLVIRSTARSQGWRVSHFKLNGVSEMIERHTNKWFLVRNSYIMYVSDLYSTTPLDIFLVDSKFKVRISGNSGNSYARDMEWNPDSSKKLATKLLITLENSERKLQVITKSEYLLKQWITSILQMTKQTVWSLRHRFESFAPIRNNAYCKFLVDGRDYFWALSDALLMAEDVIYIHDWWLSPELYMRRPVNGNQQYRLDRILKERAEKGVKIFIVVYRNVGNIVGTDSLWTKHSMLNLHPNVHLIRSPNQWLQNTYFWAHHEKLVVIDNTIAFMGGVDLCYGRYDTPEHVLRDDHADLKDQIFPGKDYSNARVCDFFELDKPFESMYDRNDLPRMPWHDVHMMTVGEPARDMARHFVQRWNYLLRQKRPSRPTPLLTPPSDFTSQELENSPFFKLLKSRSTCEAQILRSTGNWSMGLKDTEKSIQNAYLKLIETSEHYIYIENQFFVTSSRWDGVIIENKIGDAIIDRIIRANSEGKTWKAIILIPLMPGFDSPIDQPEASSLRLIMQCQYQCISRGETSIFARLRKLNIDPTEYIQLFSLRKWSTLGPHDKLVTEQVYVHSKLLIVDDRSCIIGSANINERSQAGNRDSEVAIIIRDTDLVKSKMDGKDYYAGRFPWELRQRLMREHIGCDVDLIEIVERKFGRLEDQAKKNFPTLHTLNENCSVKDKVTSSMIELAYRKVLGCDFSSNWEKKYRSSNIENFGCVSEIPSEAIDPESENRYEDISSVLDLVDETSNFSKLPERKKKVNVQNKYHSFNYRAGIENIGIFDKKSISNDPRLNNNIKHEKEVEGFGPDGWKTLSSDYKKSVTEQLRVWALEAFAGPNNDGEKDFSSTILPDKHDIEMYMSSDEVSNVSKWDMLKRISYLQHLTFKKKTKVGAASRSVPDSARKDESKKRHTAHAHILEEQELDEDGVDDLLMQTAPSFKNDNYSKSRLLNLKFIDPYSFEDPLSDSFYEDIWFSVALRNTLLFRMIFHCQPDNAVQTWRDYKDYQRMSDEFNENQNRLIDLEFPDSKVTTAATGGISENDSNSEQCSLHGVNEKNEIISGNDEPKVQSFNNNKRAKAAALKMNLSGSLLFGFNSRLFDRYSARKILDRVHGNLVIFPTEWLAKEVESRNWFYNSDRLPPIEIFN